RGARGRVARGLDEPVAHPLRGSAARRRVPASRRRARVAQARGRLPARLPEGGRPSPGNLRLGEEVSGFEVRAATVADAPGIRRLFERIFKTVLTEEEWRWKFAQDPDGWHAVVGILDGELVATYAGWGMRFLLDAARRLLYSVGDVATGPSVRALGGRR